MTDRQNVLGIDNAPRAEHNRKMKVGYASSPGFLWLLMLRYDALVAAGCTTVCLDRHLPSTCRADKGLGNAISRIGRGDTLTVYSVGCLGASLSRAALVVAELSKRGACLESLADGFAMPAASPRIVFYLARALDQLNKPAD